MADSADANDVGAEALQANADQGVVSRVSSLPLVSSAVGAVSSAYASTKDSVPLLKGVMDAAESGVRTLGAAASSGSQPLLSMLEPQIAAVSDYALMGLDQVEARLPILHQPADKLVSDAVGMVYGSVSGARQAVMGAVMGGVELSRAALGGGLSSVMGSRLGQMASSGMGLALSRSETWVDQNLPLSERELAALSEPAPHPAPVAVTTGPAAPDAGASYFVRLGKLSSAVRARALEHSLLRARGARDAAVHAAAQIASTLDLLEGARSTLGAASSTLGAASSTLGAARSQLLAGPPEQLLQSLKEWKDGRPAAGETTGETTGETAAEVAAPTAQDTKEQLEGLALASVRGLTEQLQAACSGVVSSAAGLPAAVQEQLAAARQSAGELRSALGSGSTLTPLLLEQSRRNLLKVQQSVDAVMDYLLNNTPLNWLVGPFSPQLTEKGAEPGAATPQ